MIRMMLQRMKLIMLIVLELCRHPSVAQMRWILVRMSVFASISTGDAVVPREQAAPSNAEACFPFAADQFNDPKEAGDHTGFTTYCFNHMCAYGNPMVCVITVTTTVQQMEGHSVEQAGASQHGKMPWPHRWMEASQRQTLSQAH